MDEATATTVIDQAFAELIGELAGETADWIERRQSEAEAEVADLGDDDWVPDFYLRQLRELDALQAAIDEQYDRRDKQLQARRVALRYHYAKRAQRVVDAKLAEQAGKKRSVDFEFGRCGYRKVAGREKLVVEDERAAIAAAADVCPIALKTTLLKTPVMKHFSDTGEIIDGTDVIKTPDRDVFYIGGEKFQPEECDEGSE